MTADLVAHTPAPTGLTGSDAAAAARAVGLEIEAPLMIDDPAHFDWAHEADIVVVGLGGAGVAAALEGVEQNLKVIAIDRFEGGGSSAANGGVYYAGGGTSIQHEAGEEDTPGDMYDYLKMEVGDVVSDATLRRFVAESVPSFEWLQRNGVKFNSKLWNKKASYPPLDRFLYHPDNSLVANYSANAKPAARGHRVFVRNGKKAWGLGRGIFEPLRDAALKLGLVFHRHSEACQLAVDNEGRVIGVRVLSIPPNSPSSKAFERNIARAERFFAMLPPSFPAAAATIALGNHYLRKARAIERTQRQSRWIRVHGGLVLSAGGFIMNPAMVKQFAPKYSKALPNGTLGDQGSGIYLGMTCGADAGLMHRISPWRFINPPKAWGDSIVVNAKGERFVDETVYGATLGEHIGEHQNGVAYLIYDASARRDALKQAFDPTIVPFQRDITLVNLLLNSRKARSLDTLANDLGFNPDTLKQTVDQYNQAAQGLAPDAFGKNKSDMRPLNRGPFYAMDISVSSRFLPLAAMTVGGLRIEEESGRALDVHGQPIAALYAAGRTAIGIPSQTYVSGLSYADCIFSGRRAARHIAESLGSHSYSANPVRQSDCGPPI